MTAEQLKSLLNHHRRIENLLFRTIVVLVLIAIFVFIVERDITMDSESFNDCFYVTAKVLEEAFCLLTRNMICYSFFQQKGVAANNDKKSRPRHAEIYSVYPDLPLTEVPKQCLKHCCTDASPQSFTPVFLFPLR